jgi:hypothetical protein
MRCWPIFIAGLMQLNASGVLGVTVSCAGRMSSACRQWSGCRLRRCCRQRCGRQRSTRNVGFGWAVGNRGPTSPNVILRDNREDGRKQLLSACFMAILYDEESGCAIGSWLFHIGSRCFGSLQSGIMVGFLHRDRQDVLSRVWLKDAHGIGITPHFVGRYFAGSRCGHA